MCVCVSDVLKDVMTCGCVWRTYTRDRLSTRGENQNDRHQNPPHFLSLFVFVSTLTLSITSNLSESRDTLLSSISLSHFLTLNQRRRRKLKSKSRSPCFSIFLNRIQFCTIYTIENYLYNVSNRRFLNTCEHNSREIDFQEI